MRKKKPEPPAEYSELPIEDGKEAAKVYIFIEKISDILSADTVMQKVRQGNIVIAGIKDVKERKDELRQIISKLKNMTASSDGDIIGVGDEWLILAPKSAEIVR